MRELKTGARTITSCEKTENGMFFIHRSLHKTPIAVQFNKGAQKSIIERYLFLFRSDKFIK